MKRIFTLVVILCLCISGVAVAEGKLKATEKVLYVIEGDNNAYFFCKVENVGDAPIGTDSGDLVAFTEDDEILFTESYVSSQPSSVMLDPGEYVYVYEYIIESALKEYAVADYKFSVGSRKSGTPIACIETDASIDLQGAGTYSNYIIVTLKNESDKMLEEPYVVVALYDVQGNLLYVGYDSMSNISIHPNSTITLSISVDNKLMEHYEKNGLVPDNVNALVYYEE